MKFGATEETFSTETPEALKIEKTALERMKRRMLKE